MAAGLGLAAPGEAVDAPADLLSRFDPARLPTAPWAFDPESFAAQGVTPL